MSSTKTGTVLLTDVSARIGSKPHTFGSSVNNSFTGSRAFRMVSLTANVVPESFFVFNTQVGS